MKPEQSENKPQIKVQIGPAPSDYHIEDESNNHLVDAWIIYKGKAWVIAWTYSEFAPVYTYLSRLQQLQNYLEDKNPQKIDPSKRLLTVQTSSLNPEEQSMKFKIDRFERLNIEEEELIQARLDTEFFSAIWADFSEDRFTLASHHNDPSAFTDFVMENSKGIRREDLHDLISDLSKQVSGNSNPFLQ